jgi:serine/threonine-protein kinase
MPLKFLGQEAGQLPRIDRYELIAEIASGGMASVYLSRLVGMGGFERFFAIKRLHPHLGNDEGFVSMFLDEARIVAGIRHPHVVPVLEVGASDHGYYLVMEYIEGDTLGTLLTRGMSEENPIPPEVAIRIILDVLAGLHAAHEHVDAAGRPIGLVHRDVSPQNILIDINGVARIADFGVAHATSRLSSTRSGQLKGKVAYMAPEQARGQTVTPRSDVFAAAIVLWEALTRKRLFLAENEAVTLNRLIFEPVPPIRSVNPSLPVALEQVLDRALQRDPAKRYASASDLADELQSTARACRLLGSPSDVKNYVRSVIGVPIERRRASVREHLGKLARVVPHGTPGPLDRPDLGVVKPTDSSVSAAAMAVPTPVSHPSLPREVTSPTAPSMRTPVSSRRFLAFVVLGGAVGVLAVAGAVLALQGNQPETGTQAEDSPDGILAGASTGSNVLGSLPTSPATTEADAATSAPAASTTPVVPSPPVTKKPRVSGEKPSSPPTTTSQPTSQPTTKPPPVVEPATPAVVDDLKRNPYR